MLMGCRDHTDSISASCIEVRGSNSGTVMGNSDISSLATEKWQNFISLHATGTGGRAIRGVVLRPLVGWDCGFESRQQHGCAVCCECCVFQVVSASGRSLAQRSPNECLCHCDQV
jgi:hypothetical protein